MTVRAGRSRIVRAVIWVVGIVLGINLALITVDRAIGGGGRGGPPSSSFSTGLNGLAAYADLLASDGHAIARSRRALAHASLDPSSTLVVLDAQLDREDAAAVRAFVAGGGRLVAGGSDPSWLADAIDGAPVWERTVPGTVVPLAPVPEAAGVREIETADVGVWRDARTSLPALAADSGALLVVKSVGEGRVALLASSGVLHNDSLAQGDNAALGLALAGPSSRPVVFAEHEHGYGEEQGIGAIPARARWALAGLGIAAAAWLFGRARRLGPPQARSRALSPPRRMYVDSLAALIGRTRKRDEAITVVRRASRDRVSRRAGLARDVSDDRIVEAARKLGLTDQEAEALVRSATSDRDVLATGRALAKLEGRFR